MALPLLLDLASKPNFLHDNSVSCLNDLLNASRSPKAPHPFYLQGAQRAEVIAFLRGLDTGNRQTAVQPDQPGGLFPRH